MLHVPRFLYVLQCKLPVQLCSNQFRIDGYLSQILDIHIFIYVIVINKTVANISATLHALLCRALFL